MAPLVTLPCRCFRGWVEYGVVCTNCNGTESFTVRIDAVNGHGTPVIEEDRWHEVADQAAEWLRARGVVGWQTGGGITLPLYAGDAVIDGFEALTNGRAA